MILYNIEKFQRYIRLAFKDTGDKHTRHSAPYNLLPLLEKRDRGCRRN